MKKPYVKPIITVERLMIDQPMAVGCTADFDDMRSLIEMGYFTAEGYDTICYHGNVQTAFTS